jgi:hypothetical protein
VCPCRLLSKQLFATCSHSNDNSRSACFCVHTKLHAGIRYSHPADTVWAHLPPLTPLRYNHRNHRNHSLLLEQVLSQEDDTDNDDEGGQPLLFAYSAGSRGSDWHYPVDFCGGLYRYTDIVAMLDCVPAYADFFTHAASADGTLRILLCELRWAEQLFVLPCLFFASFAGESSLKLNPNILEVELNRVFWQTQSPTGSNNAVVRHPSTGIAGDGVDLGAVTAGRELVSSPFQHSYAHALCLSADVLCVVTVNRVQTTYNVPIYASVASSTKKDDNDNDECTSTVANGDNNIIAICDGSEESLNALLCVDTNGQVPSTTTSHANPNEPAVDTSTCGCVKRSLDGAKYRWDCNKTSVSPRSRHRHKPYHLSDQTPKAMLYVCPY